MSRKKCPVFKKGNRSNPSNYRPISLTSSCCKVFEHIVFHSIMDHLQLNNILINNQHGFRSGFSCQTQLISLIEDVSHALDNQLQTDLILLDFSKAFDTVPHKRLLVNSIITELTTKCVHGSNLGSPSVLNQSLLMVYLHHLYVYYLVSPRGLS